MKKKTFLFSKLIFTFFILSLSYSFINASDFPDDVLKAKSAIKGKMLVSHINFLASKFCRGRETGEFGMEVADKYITSVLKGADLEPAGDYGTYFQPVKLKTVSLCKKIHLKVEERVGGVNLTKQANLEWDYLPIYISAEREVSAPLVFAGYGITAPEHKYDDYKNLNVKGKIVLVMRHEPGENDESSPFEGRKLSKHGTLLSKILNAQKHGAVGILFVTDPLNHKDQSATGSWPSGTYWPSLRRQKLKKDEDVKYMRFSPRMRIVGDDFGVKIPAVIVDGKFADYLLGEDNSLEKIQDEMDKNLRPRSFPVTGKRVTLGVFFKTEYIKANNIVFKVRGNDPELQKEYVIIGAHYDHVGKDNRGRVYGGADDNASGTAGVIEIARAFKNLKIRPKRSLLFILFTAEEKGLLGARYYVKNPMVPLEKTIAMINMDMIGRNDVEQMSLIGKYQYPKIFKIINSINRKSVNFEFNFSIEEFIMNSDHMPFMRENVPSVFFNSGSHDQLHKPEDTVHLIIPDKIEKVSQLIFLSAWKIADLPSGTNLK